MDMTSCHSAMTNVREERITMKSSSYLRPVSLSRRPDPLITMPPHESGCLIGDVTSFLIDNQLRPTWIIHSSFGSQAGSYPLTDMAAGKVELCVSNCMNLWFVLIRTLSLMVNIESRGSVQEIYDESVRQDGSGGSVMISVRNWLVWHFTIFI